MQVEPNSAPQSDKKRPEYQYNQHRLISCIYLSSPDYLWTYYNTFAAYMYIFLTALLTFFIIGDIIGLKESAQAP